MKPVLAIAALAASASALTMRRSVPEKEQQQQQDHVKAGQDYAATECASRKDDKEQCLENKALGYKYSREACQTYGKPNQECLDVALAEFAIEYPVKTPLHIINDRNVPPELQRELHNHYLWTQASPDVRANKTHLAEEHCRQPREQYTLNCRTFYQRIYVFAHELCVRNPNVTQHHLTMQDCEDTSAAHHDDWTTEFSSTNWVWAKFPADFDKFIADKLQERADIAALQRDAAAHAQTECAKPENTNNKDCVAFETQYFEKSRDLCVQIIEFSVLPDFKGPKTHQDCYDGFHKVAKEKLAAGDEDFNDKLFWYQVRGTVNPQELKPRVGRRTNGDE